MARENWAALLQLLAQPLRQMRFCLHLCQCLVSPRAHVVNLVLSTFFSMLLQQCNEHLEPIFAGSGFSMTMKFVCA